ncbi:MAG: SAM-dependent methyltransferase [Chloroflexi bacterium]|nr:SAM-dependent methyltransferase [Chloroflexota bacterium]
MDSTPMYVLESDALLSRSMLWRLQRTFYTDQGIAAWSQSRVPQSVTTSPNIANAYARIALGFLRDIRGALDPDQPIYFVELGAGSGRFGFRFLKVFSHLLQNHPDVHQRFVYVMTDASPTVLEFWRDNPRLRPFVDAGHLDFAHFDLLDPAPMQLLIAGATLDARGANNSIVVIANYIFDSIPQDAVTIADRQLFANRVTVSASSPELDLAAPDSKVRISINFSTDSMPLDLDEEPDAALRRILQTYRERLPSTTLLVPRAAISCVNFFRNLGGGKALFLVGDFGDAHEDELANHGPPGFGANGGFWLAVNFHLLGQYARQQGGRARHPRGRHLSLNISALIFGLEPGGGASQAELAYADTVDLHGPDELAVVHRAVAERLPDLKLDVVLGLLRGTGWDPDYLSRCVPALLEALPSAPDRLRREMFDGIQQAWDQYYPIGERDDVPFGIGVLLYSLERYLEALQFFERSLRDFGEDPRTTLNLAMTSYRLERRAETLQWLDRTLELDPSNELAQAMRPDVAAELAEGR